MFVHCLSFCGLGPCECWWVVDFQVDFFFSVYMMRLKSYGKFNNAASATVHTVPFMLHISSTPVVKYLAVIIAYLFKW